MGCCYSGDHIAEDYKHMNITTCKLSNHNRSTALERSVINYLRALTCFTDSKPRPLLLPAAQNSWSAWRFPKRADALQNAPSIRVSSLSISLLVMFPMRFIFNLCKFLPLKYRTVLSRFLFSPSFILCVFNVHVIVIPWFVLL